MSRSRSSSAPSSGNIILHLDTANYVIGWLACSSSLYQPLLPAEMEEKKRMIACFKKQIKADRPRCKDDWTDLEAQGKWLSLSRCHELLKIAAASLAAQRLNSTDFASTELIAQQHLALSFYAQIPPGRGLSVRGLIVTDSDRGPTKGKEDATLSKVGNIFKLRCFPKTYLGGIETTAVPPALGAIIQDFLDREWKAARVNPKKFLFLKSGSEYDSSSWASLLRSATSTFSNGECSVSVNKLRSAFVTHQESDSTAGASVKEASAKAMMHSRSTAVKTYLRSTPEEQKALGIAYATSLSDQRRHVLIKHNSGFRTALVFGDAPKACTSVSSAASSSSASMTSSSSAYFLAMFYSSSHYNETSLICKLERDTLFAISKLSILGDLKMNFDVNNSVLTTSVTDIKCLILRSQDNKEQCTPAYGLSRESLVAPAGDHVLIQGTEFAQLLDDCDFSKSEDGTVAVQLFKQVGIGNLVYLPGKLVKECCIRSIVWPVDSIFNGNGSPAGWILCEDVARSISLVLTDGSIHLANAQDKSGSSPLPIGTAEGSGMADRTLPVEPLVVQVEPFVMRRIDEDAECAQGGRSGIPDGGVETGQLLDCGLGKRIRLPDTGKWEASQFTQAELNYLSTGVATFGNKWAKILDSFPFEKGKNASILRAKWRAKKKRTKAESN